MLSDDVFYSKFRDIVLGDRVEPGKEEKEGIIEEGDNVPVADKKCQRTKFLMHQVEMIPVKSRDFYCNMMRNYPTSPLYLFLGIGMLGTNVARYTAVRRMRGSITNVVRTGCFYNFLAPSRFGKGIALGVISKIGTEIEKVRTKAHQVWTVKEQRAKPNNSKEIEDLCKSLRPNIVFLTGGNALQT